MAREEGASAIPSAEPVAVTKASVAPERVVDDPDAVVLAVQGAVQVRGEGVDLAARVDLPLVREDGLAVGGKSVLLLLLRNGYAVRLDEDLELKVKDIALLDAPPAEATLEEQLRELVDDGELEGPPPDRIVGWQQRLRAGRGLVARAEEQGAGGNAGLAREEEEGATLRVTAAAQAGPPPPPPAPITGRALGSADVNAAAEPPGGGRDGGSLPAKDDVSPPVKTKRGKEAKKREAPPHRYRAEPGGPWVAGLPPLIEAKEEALRACLREAAPRLAKSGRPLALLLRFGAGEIDRVAIVGAQSVPCAVALFSGASDPVVVGDGWLRVELAGE